MSTAGSPLPARPTSSPLVGTLALGLALALPLGGCGSDLSSEEVQTEIDAANYCAASAECVDLGSHCPFGCHVLVNQAKQSEILDLIREYQSSTDGQQCTYSCEAIDGFECSGGRCVVRPLT